ncbi:MAG: hypothetical protein ACTIAG_04545 [Lactobacillus sp.]
MEFTESDDMLVIHTKTQRQGTAPVFISIPTHRKLKAIAGETNVSMRDLLEQITQFGLAHMVIKDGDDNATD